MRAYRRVALLHRVMVNLTTGKAVEGVLLDERGPLLIVKNAVLHEPGAPAPVPMDGAVVIERSRVDFVQVLGEQVMR
jgi:hypothetical protein